MQPPFIDLLTNRGRFRKPRQADGRVAVQSGLGAGSIGIPFQSVHAVRDVAEPLLRVVIFVADYH